MSKGAIALAAVFIAVAGWQAAGALLPQDDVTPPPTTPTTMVTPEPTTPAPEPGSPQPTEAELPRVPGPPPPARRYASVEEITRQLMTKGLECTFVQHLDQPDPTLKDFALCDMGDPTRRIDIFLYENSGTRNLWLPGLKDVDIVYGPNWIITGAGDIETIPARLRSIRNTLGGKLQLR